MRLHVIVYRASGDCIPWYGLYSLLFADHGLSTAEVSSLLVIWSVTGFVLEVPSGAWADTVSRRGLLILSGLLLTLGFVSWILAPGYLGFAVGFVLWGIAGALASGTFEALLYDELSACAAADDYPRVLGYVTSATEIAALAAILVSAPLYRWGGYALVGWVSVGFALLHTALATLLPDASRTAPSAEPSGSAAPRRARCRVMTRYRAMLRAGISETVRGVAVRRGVLLLSVLTGYCAVDEYFGLLAADAGAATELIPLLVAITVVGSALGTAFAGWLGRARRPVLAAVLIAAGIAAAAGVVSAGPGVRLMIGFAAIGVGYGAVYCVVVIAEARLQDAIDGPARATVTSVANLLSETMALAVFAVVALVSRFGSIAAALVVLTIPVLAIALVLPRWLPLRADSTGAEFADPETSEVNKTSRSVD